MDPARPEICRLLSAGTTSIDPLFPLSFLTFRKRHLTCTSQGSQVILEQSLQFPFAAEALPTLPTLSSVELLVSNLDWRGHVKKSKVYLIAGFGMDSGKFETACQIWQVHCVYERLDAQKVCCLYQRRWTANLIRCSCHQPRVLCHGTDCQSSRDLSGNEDRA
jgi:hypothetical protein